MRYIWQNKQWPELRWDDTALAKLLTHVSREQGRLLGKMEGLGFDLRAEAHLRTLTEDVVKSSEIEGEKLERDQVRSSIARRLGMDIAGLISADRDVEGVVEMMIGCDLTLCEAAHRETPVRLARGPVPDRAQRHARDQGRRMARGRRRADAGRVGRRSGGRRVHYEAPPAARVPKEMEKFLDWFAKPGDLDPLLVAGLAHLWFVTIHPFEDGNGRIARAIADMALARSEGTGQRFYSMSGQIRHERSDVLRHARAHAEKRHRHHAVARPGSSNACCARSKVRTTRSLPCSRKRASGSASPKQPLNERQIKALNRLLDGFEGKLTSSKWAKLTKSSQDTAHRDIVDLVERGALQKDEGGGRSTSYSLVTK